MTIQVRPAALVAEFIGTFFLALVAILATATVGAPLSIFLVALTVGLFVATIGHASGAHLNPAVTVAALAVRSVNAATAIGYLLMQFLGAGLAMLIADSLLEKQLVVTATNTFMVSVGEGLGAFLFAFGIAAVIFEKVRSENKSFVIGGSLFVSLILSSVASLGIINPAIAMALGAFNVAYLVGPIIGAILGMFAYKVIFTDFGNRFTVVKTTKKIKA